jgi:hypothetical protein
VAPLCNRRALSANPSSRQIRRITPFPITLFLSALPDYCLLVRSSNAAAPDIPASRSSSAR